ncbi:MAG: hypothetical protein OXN44_03790 [Acidimicrobiaceae bacterium]|nr:hypothetical protein [Acidimicrobiaceae bacterium]
MGRSTKVAWTLMDGLVATDTPQEVHPVENFLTILVSVTTLALSACVVMSEPAAGVGKPTVPSKA